MESMRLKVNDDDEEDGDEHHYDDKVIINQCSVITDHAPSPNNHNSDGEDSDLLPGVDRDSAGVGDDHDAHYELVLLQHHVGHQRHQVQGLILPAVQFCHHHQQVGPGKHSTGNNWLEYKLENSEIIVLTTQQSSCGP
jgi:hypothetical protein